MTPTDNAWADNLLVKEKTGQIHALKVAPLAQTAPKQVFLSIPTAPVDEHFSHVSGTDFSFHPDDQGELLHLSKSLPQDDSKKYSIGKIVDRLIQKQGLRFDDAGKQKFTNLLLDFFRDRKKSFVVREALAAQVDPGMVDGIMAVIRGIKNKIDTVGGLVVDTVVPEPRPAPVLLPIPKPVPKIEPAPEPKPEPKPVPKPEPISESKPIAVSVITPKVLPKVSRPQSAPQAKKQMSDVKYEKPVSRSSLMGPIQELEALTLKNFRYLGDTAQDRIDKIHEKISVLEKQSFAKKAEGIKAWRACPVYQLYLALGSDSMSGGQDIAQTIVGYTQAGKETLTLEEFSAISDLNKMLRF